MKYRKICSLIAAALILAGSVSGCAAPNSQTNTENTAASAGETSQAEMESSETPVSQENGEAKESKESTDVIQGNPIGGEPVITVGEDQVSYGLLYTNIALQKQYYETAAKEYYKWEVTEEDWNSEYSEGVTVAENMVNAVRDTLVDQVVCYQHAEELGITLPEDSREQLISSAKDSYDTIEKDILEKSGLTLEDWTWQKELNYYYDLVASAAVKDYTPKISDEEARTCRFLIYAVALEGSVEGAEGLPTLEEAESKSRELLERVEAGEDFKTVAEEFGYSPMEDTMSVNQYPDDENAVKLTGLKAGEYMTFVPENGSYCVAYCINEADPEATQARKEVLFAEAQQQRFLEILNGWVDESKPEFDYNLIDSMDIF